MTANSAILAGGAADSLARAAVRMVRDPLRTLDWGLEVAGSAVSLAGRGVTEPPGTAVEHQTVPAWAAAPGRT